MFLIDDCLRYIHGTCVSKRVDCSLQGVSIDTRTTLRGECFVAIRGERYDGHTFLLQAHSKHAACFIVDQAFVNALVKNDDDYSVKVMSLPNVIVVDDTVQALGLLAQALRREHSARAVGITGSCGKTTTKELVASLLSTKYDVLHSKGNYNNHLGLPLSLSKLSHNHSIIVSEMGASQPGDIGYLTRILHPEIGVVTNVHPVHLAGFGNLENIYTTKLEVAEYLDLHNGTLVVFGDDEKLLSRASDYNVNLVTFGKGKDNDFVLTDSCYRERSIHFEVNGTYRFRMNTLAEYDVYNALAAIAVADYFGIDLRTVPDVFENYTQLSGRLNVFEGDILLIDDSYNANPYSFNQVLNLVRKIKVHNRRVVVCGDMLELGAESAAYHAALGEHIVQAGADLVIGVGQHVFHTIDAIQRVSPEIEAKCFSCNDDALLFLREEITRGDCVLVKGSRGIKLDEIVQVLCMAFNLEKNRQHI